MHLKRVVHCATDVQHLNEINLPEKQQNIMLWHTKLYFPIKNNKKKKKNNLRSKRFVDVGKQFAFQLIIN